MTKKYITFILLITLFMLQACLQQPDKTPLMQAAVAGDLPAIKKLIEQGAEIKTRNQAGYDALFYAVMNAQPEIVQYLLAKGADVNGVDTRGTTALIVASAVGNKEIIETLHSYGARVYQPNRYGITPLIAAAGAGKPQAIEKLLAYGADPCVKDRNGHNALQTAQQWHGVLEMQEAMNKNPLLRGLICKELPHE